MDSKESKIAAFKKYEKDAQIVGWNFSFLDGLIEEEELPFNYVSIVNSFLTGELKLLDMETGAGEVLLTLNHPYINTTVTEGYLPNYALCLERLSPLGIKVYNVLGESKLPFDDNTFDIVINRHGAYQISEIKRILKPGGVFITQQVGDKNNLELSLALGIERVVDTFSLKSEVKKFIKEGFDILDSDEYYQNMRYKHIKAVIFMAKIIVWEFPGFSVRKCIDSLIEIENEIERIGYINSTEHRFFFVAKNKGDTK